jgi:hypothetical protein
MELHVMMVLCNREWVGFGWFHLLGSLWWSPTRPEGEAWRDRISPNYDCSLAFSSYRMLLALLTMVKRVYWIGQTVLNMKISWLQRRTRSVSHCGLAIYITKYLKAKEELWKLKYFTIQKYNLQKILWKKPKILQDIL